MTEQNPYDEVPYGEAAHPASHPARAAAIATLLGLTPAPLERCRVLELGCAGGSNLIPLAYLLPNSEFVGIDYSARQIEKGQRAVATLELKNITLHALDVRAMDDTFGQFDYIIAHGLYSWVPAEVREAVMALCQRHLAPNGIIYMSYNTYPGWRMLQIAREAMQFRTRHTEAPMQRAEQGREFIGLLAQVPINEYDTLWSALMHQYKGLMTVEAALLNSKPTNVLLHDELEAVNDPCYFSDFVAHAAQHGLEYLSEIDFPTMLPSNLPPLAATGVQKMATSLYELEQYIDFVRNRTFRQTLLVHQGTLIQRQLKPERLAGLYIRSGATLGEVTPDGQAQGALKFVSEDQIGFTTADPFIKAMFQILMAHAPQSLTLVELAAQVLAELAPTLPKLPTRAELEQHLAAHALMAFTRSTGLIDLQAYRAPFTTTISERPQVSAFTRWQLKQGAVVTSQTHENYELDTIAAMVAAMLDGTRTREDLVDMLRVLLVRPENDTDAEFEARLVDEIGQQLLWLARHALLVG